MDIVNAINVKKSMTSSSLMENVSAVCSFAGAIHKLVKLRKHVQTVWEKTKNHNVPIELQKVFNAYLKYNMTKQNIVENIIEMNTKIMKRITRFVFAILKEDV